MTETTFRSILPEDLPEYGRLIDNAFSLSEPLHYLADFPVWDPAITNQKNRYQRGAWVDGELAATASLRVARYRIEPGQEFNFGLIGAVATHPKFQGKGLGSKLLESLIAESESRKVDAFILWGSESPIYRKKGFEFGGLQLRSNFDQLKFEGDLLEGYEIRTGWEEAIAEQMIKRTAGLLYQDADVLWLSRHGGVEWRTLWIEERCVAYCGWNRGIDLPNLIHEYGGTEIGIRTLLEFISRRYTFLELLHHPDLSKTGIVSSAEAEYLAQFRIQSHANTLRDRLDKIWFSGMDSC